MDRDENGGKRRYSVEGNGDGCGCFCILVADEQPVDDECQERTEENQVAESDVVNHGGPSTGLRQGSYGDGTWFLLSYRTGN